MKSKKARADRREMASDEEEEDSTLSQSQSLEQNILQTEIWKIFKMGNLCSKIHILLTVSHKIFYGP